MSNDADLWKWVAIVGGIVLLRVVMRGVGGLAAIASGEARYRGIL